MDTELSLTEGSPSGEQERDDSIITSRSLNLSSWSCLTWVLLLLVLPTHPIYKKENHMKAMEYLETVGVDYPIA